MGNNDLTFEHQIFDEAKRCAGLYRDAADEQLLSSSYETIGRIVMESIWRGNSLLIMFPSLKEDDTEEGGAD